MVYILNLYFDFSFITKIFYMYVIYTTLTTLFLWLCSFLFFFTFYIFFLHFLYFFTFCISLFFVGSPLEEDTHISILIQELAICCSLEVVGELDLRPFRDTSKSLYQLLANKGGILGQSEGD